jgi:transcriptional regulator with XRE-family HTH domain
MSVGYVFRKYPNRLRITRQNAGLQQRQVWEMLGHTQNKLLSQWENETVMPSGSNLIKLCVLYDKTPRELYPEYYERLEDCLEGM